MEIGLLTFHRYNNYGAVLQAYAMMTALRNMGFQCHIVDLRSRPRNRLVSGIYERVFNRAFYRFREEHLTPCTSVYYPDDDLGELNQQFDCFVVGSDQVWRPELTRERTLRYFLDFADNNALKVSYAASFGVSTWCAEPRLTETARRLLRDFDAISVREESGVEICRQVFGVGATRVLDPTLLLGPSDYDELLAEATTKLPADYGVSFFLDSDVQVLEGAAISLLEHLQRLPVIRLSIPRICFRGNAYHCAPRSVPGWLHALKHSEVIVTESFHCVVFAVMFRKKFICVINHRRGAARLRTFLGLLGLDDFLIEREECTEERFAELLRRDVAWDEVTSALAASREESKQFVEKALVGDWGPVHGE